MISISIIFLLLLHVVLDVINDAEELPVKRKAGKSFYVTAVFRLMYCLKLAPLPTACYVTKHDISTVKLADVSRWWTSARLKFWGSARL